MALDRFKKSLEQASQYKDEVKTLGQRSGSLVSKLTAVVEASTKVSTECTSFEEASKTKKEFLLLKHMKEQIDVDYRLIPDMNLYGSELKAIIIDLNTAKNAPHPSVSGRAELLTNLVTEFKELASANFRTACESNKLAAKKYQQIQTLYQELENRNNQPGMPGAGEDSPSQTPRRSSVNSVKSALSMASASGSSTPSAPPLSREHTPPSPMSLSSSAASSRAVSPASRAGSEFKQKTPDHSPHHSREHTPPSPSPMDFASGVNSPSDSPVHGAGKSKPVPQISLPPSAASSSASSRAVSPAPVGNRATSPAPGRGAPVQGKLFGSQGMQRPSAPPADQVLNPRGVVSPSRKPGQQGPVG